MLDYLYEDSSLTSPYYEWLCEMGYRELDIVVANDGEWWVIQYLNAPVIPSMTKHEVVIHGFKGVVLCKGFVERVVKSIDPTRKEFWEAQEAQSLKVELEAEKKEKFQEESAEKKMQIIRRCPELMELVAKHGTDQVLPHKIFKNLTPHQKRSFGYVGRKLFSSR